MEEKTCIGCGDVSESHPWVAVFSQAWLKEQLGEESDSEDLHRFRKHPCCAECHSDPSHRRVTLKAHFFPRQRGEAAVIAAGSGSIG